MFSRASLVVIDPSVKGAPNHLQTTWVWIGVSYLAEQPLRCDLLKVSLQDPLDSPATRRASLLFLLFFLSFDTLHTAGTPTGGLCA